jgi:TatD DNase family protein
LIDAHCHLQSARFEAPIEAVVASARTSGVEAIILAGVEPEGWQRQAELAAQFPDVWPVLGIHPWVAATLDDAGLDRMMAALERALENTPRVVAIGESGLDGYTDAHKVALDRQEASMRRHLGLAARTGLPIVLHSVKAHAPILRVLKDAGIPDAGGVVHSFSGSAELARAYVALGLHVSFSGTLTFGRSRRLQEAAIAVPDDRLLIETDAPDQTPEPHRGTPNQPANLPLVASALAELRGSTPAHIASVTSANARRLFGLPASTAPGSSFAG